MQRRSIGKSGLEVSPICLGTMMFGGMTDEVESARIIHHALDNGVNFIDTADVYCGGRSEEIVGQAISEHRDRWILATKIGMPVKDVPNSGGLSSANITNGIEQSLRRLDTDYVDIYYAHRYDPDRPIEEIVETFGGLIKSGKIRSFGVSNISAWQLVDLIHHCLQASVPPPIVCQPYYNLLNRMPEVELIPACRHFGLGVVPYSPVARGVLTGKYLPDAAPPEDSRAARQDARMMMSEWRPESLRVAARLKEQVALKNARLLHFAVSWVLNNRAVSAAIAGPRTFTQWTDYLHATDYVWTADDEKLVDQLVSPGHPSTPGYTDPKYPVLGRFAETDADPNSG